MCRIFSAMVAIFLWALLVPPVPGEAFDLQKGTICSISMNGQFIGCISGESDARSLYHEARRLLTGERGQMVLTDIPEFEIATSEVWFAAIDDDRIIVEKMKKLLEASAEEELSPAYSVKVNSVLVSLENSDEITDIFGKAIDNYDTEDNFEVSLVRDTDRELNALTVIIEDKREKATSLYKGVSAGTGVIAESEKGWLFENSGKSFDDFDYCINDMYFSEKIEVAESYVNREKLTEPEIAGAELTGLKDEVKVYKVQSGDTLSEIAFNAGIPLDDIIALNEAIENENTAIHVDQEILINKPEPELAVLWSEVKRMEEIYDLPTEYIYNDSWYTNESKVITQPSAGCRDAVVEVTCKNDEPLEETVLYAEVNYEPVAKVVEIGTIAPPSFIKPISGGRMSSPFGYRTRPTAGASSYHKGIDWATPTGTAVYASCGGTVIRAGWAGGYGNVIYIEHPNGMQTRYGHLSKIYVSVGDKVRQGDVIAASGSTGVSTGPHIHFEILVDGVQVDPMGYL